ncbi:MAG: Gx transporter family protein [Bacillota bacterium]|nr:Gx transporter family protein [Bacillota bacterium]
MQQRTNSFTSKKLTQCAMLTALALIFSYIEFLVPISIGLPGIKLGIANIVIVVAIYKLGGSYGFVINIARILLSALLFGNMFSAIYSLCGGLLSLAVMLLLKKTGWFSVIGVSMAGGVFHNVGQIMMAILLVGSGKVLYYFPVLLFAGLVTGIINGFLDTLIIRALK